MWESYELIVDEMLKSKRALRNVNEHETRLVKEFLLDRRLSSLPAPLAGGQTFRDDLKRQKHVVMDQYNFTKSQYELAVRCLVYAGDYCAKRQNPLPVMVAWQKIKQAGISPLENCVSTFMYVLGMDERCSVVLGEVATVHDLLFPPNEKTVFLRIKSLVSQNDPDSAEAVLASLPVRRI